tara:strand:- start:239 stop:949 length:711 start_codon:yes stop_codon:yes gene_type:complete
MCTLSYIPVEQGYIFTHNRDERSDRLSSQNIIGEKVANRKVYFPKDLEANGTWIAHSPKFRSACILNGGEKAYKRRASYPKSRGIMVLESFEANSIEDFYNHYNFKDLEPFTLILKEEAKLSAIVHDEDETQLKIFNPNQKQIWSSTKLYSSEVRKKREEWFEAWLKKNPELKPENISAFHQSAGDGNKESDLIMSRWGILKTVSISQIVSIKGGEEFNYWDFVGKAQDSIKFKNK